MYAFAHILSLPHSLPLSSQKDTLHPLHTILQSFPVLPPKAAHFLFNSFVGIITRHTDQPCTFSPEIIQSVLLLLTMVGQICFVIRTYRN